MILIQAFPSLLFSNLQLFFDHIQYRYGCFPVSLKGLQWSGVAVVDFRILSESHETVMCDATSSQH
jgi:hypothetical protein